MRQVPANIGAGEGTRTLVFSLEGFYQPNTINWLASRPPSSQKAGKIPWPRKKTSCRFSNSDQRTTIRRRPSLFEPSSSNCATERKQLLPRVRMARDRVLLYPKAAE